MPRPGAGGGRTPRFESEHSNPHQLWPAASDCRIRTFVCCRRCLPPTYQFFKFDHRSLTWTSHDKKMSVSPMGRHVCTCHVATCARGNVATWQRGHVATWQRGNVATWQRGRGNVATWTWQRGHEATWQRGRGNVATWQRCNVVRCRRGTWQRGRGNVDVATWTWQRGTCRRGRGNVDVATWTWRRGHVPTWPRGLLA